MDVKKMDYSLLSNFKKEYSKIANAIKFLKNNPEIRKKMFASAAEASEKFDLKVRANKIIDFIKNQNSLIKNDYKTT